MNLITTRDVAQILRCSERWVQKLCKSRALPAIKVAGHWWLKYDEDALRRVLLRRRRKWKPRWTCLSAGAGRDGSGLRPASFI